ncbi:hypothetical protein HPB51_018275 [Rhipicephalus microplus]|uniref:Uncharacterized protein n=1 Tax=Rhipicephalus microplus TaxID=6941 RepID=A0A9J6D5W4_RHIMP|nr:hypothetical protein HPB51_018275 [Rhipicephalus microplus]
MKRERPPVVTRACECGALCNVSELCIITDSSTNLDIPKYTGAADDGPVQDWFNLFELHATAASRSEREMSLNFTDYISVFSSRNNRTTPRLLRDTLLSARRPLNVMLLSLKGTPPKDWYSILKSIQVPVIQWNRLGAEQLNELKAHVNSGTKVWVVMPWSDMEQRSHLFSRLNEFVFGLSLARFVIAIQPGEHLPHEQFAELSCILVGVNDTAIDVATDGYRNCSQRKALLSPAALFDYNTGTSYSVFNTRKLITVTEVTLVTVGVRHHYTRLPEAVLLLNVLQRLNATIIPCHLKETGMGQDRIIYKVHRKEIDLSLVACRTQCRGGRTH